MREVFKSCEDYIERKNRVCYIEKKTKKGKKWNK